ncbi:histidine--tRNA ligase [Oribacterium sp. WCC10]|uniref:histidine--tRNA ligase n=1 Tax=Oribacterium sp. WCC10 TaxID=1855343 RepID=UPI0008DFD509|nr:histidine--tRNA ligase [Oribacterium sp. WCC10]SFG31283.1 histidyl-tRNA synthetase [Oribacterium sp. WCC10]
MALKKKPVTGMKDILPREMELRQYVLSEIRRTYKEFGFTEIETPVVEHIENLLSKQGGDNEKLIFKVMKRGDKLESAYQNGSLDDLSDSGLRYDLTLPLSRFYSQNQAQLPSPFKALQIGPVFRADRPQKGRFREFVQCDIDIFGDGSNVSEIELILAISTLLNRIGFGDKYNFKIVINDREILRGMQAYAGFPEEDFEKVCISLDKADKIGNEGVKEELLSLGYAEEVIDRYQTLLGSIGTEAQDIRSLGEKLKEVLPETVTTNLAEIVEAVARVKSVKVNVEFDPTLVRGMGYYTGPIFEIRAEGFGGSVGGGGRYDKMVGKFTGQDTPAVGFSIGFERIITIMLDADEKVPGEGKRIAFLLDKNLDAEKTSEALNEAMELRLNGETVLVSRMNKNKKFQKEQLTQEGYTEFKEFYQDSLN